MIRYLLFNKGMNFFIQVMQSCYRAIKGSDSLLVNWFACQLVRSGFGFMVKFLFVKSGLGFFGMPVNVQGMTPGTLNMF